MPGDLTEFSQWQSATPFNFPESHRQSEISSLWKVILVLGKASSRLAPCLGYRGTESPGWFEVSLKNAARCHDEAANHVLLNHPNSFSRGMLKFNEKFDADSLLYLLSHFECDGHSVHMLTEWCLPPPLTSTVKLSLFTHEHSSPLSLTARLPQHHALLVY